MCGVMSCDVVSRRVPKGYTLTKIWEVNSERRERVRGVYVIFSLSTRYRSCIFHRSIII